ncbi:MAG: RluA family pseudouridine synthase [Clostridia bacterium]|nr:RluA family pseudouridine synthase [Clostridia bacterium]
MKNYIDLTDENTVIVTSDEGYAGQRADAAAAAVCESLGLPLTRSAVQKLAEAGALTLKGKPVKKNYKLAAGDVLILSLPEPEALDVAPENIPLDVVYEDGDIIVINKPAGMVVHPAPGHLSGTLVSALLYHCGTSLSGIGGVMRPGIVHRIDKDTTGLICVAKNDFSHTFLSDQLKDHSMSRTYEALCIGRLPETRGKVDAPIGRSTSDRKKMAVRAGGREAVTHYEVIGEYTPKEGGAVSHLRLELETGRTHQIRVHMAYVGHPLLGDGVYGGAGTAFEKRHPALFTGQCLHASRLRLTHPRTGELMTFVAPRPENLEKIIKLLTE